MTWTVPELVLSLAALSTTTLAVLALARGPRSRLRWSFGLGMLGFAVEALVNLGLIKFSETPDERLIWLQATQAVGVLLLVAWSFFAVALGTPHTEPIPLRRSLIGVGVLLLAGAVIELSLSGFEVAQLAGPFYAARLTSLGRVGTILQLIGSVAILAGLEAALRASRGEARWRTKYLVLGLGGIFLVRFYFLSQIALFNVLFGSYLTTTAGTLVVGCLVIAMSLTRDRLGIGLAVSRDVVYRSVVVGVLGLYLLGVGVLGWLLNELGLPDELAWGSVIVFVSALGLAAVMLSEAIRWRIKRFVAVNFYRSKYDYRVQWLNFTRRLSSLVALDQLAPELLAAVVEATGAPAVVLYLRDTADGGYHSIAAFGLNRPAARIAAGVELVTAMKRDPAPRALEAGSALAEGLGNGALAVALPWRGELIGLLLVAGERTGAAYTGEDLEFFATVGQQAAGALATAQLSESLARAREFEAFHRLTSFVIHDVKNSIAALSLLTDNALKHFDDPEFQRDAVKTLARTVERMNGLLGRLSAAPDAAALRIESVDLAALALEAALPLVKCDHITLVKELATVPPIPGDPEALLRVVQNLVGNAVQSIQGTGTVTLTTQEDAGRAVLAVSDTGCGMSETFIRTSLFSPFRTTKKGGWGIGLYQAKSIVEAHGGAIEVSSAEGTGTTFRVSLPVAGGGRG